MKIDPFKIRTHSNPLNGVHFSATDLVKIEEAASALASVEDDRTMLMRIALFRGVLYLDNRSDWTEGEAETMRRSRQESTLIAYQATFEAPIARRFRDAQKAKTICNCRCREGKHCGGCGHEGCGYTTETVLHQVSTALKSLGQLECLCGTENHCEKHRLAGDHV